MLGVGLAAFRFGLTAASPSLRISRVDVPETNAEILAQQRHL